MSETFGCDDKDGLVAYLYGEIDEGRRHDVERHLRTCPACALELDELQRVRRDLAGWVPPARALDITGRPLAAGAPSHWGRARALPAWAQMAAAVLVLAAGAAIANVQVRYGDGAFTVTTGWRAAAEPAAAVVGAEGAGPAWQPALAALERELRAELAQVKQASAPLPAGRGASAVDDAAVLRRVRALLDTSEQRQRQEMALRLTQLRRDWEMQRRGDLVRIEQRLGTLQGRAFKTEAGQQEMINLLRRVSAQPIP